jgi:hypothetical protein
MLNEAPVGKSSLGRFRRRWEDNYNKVDGKELGCVWVPFDRIHSVVLYSMIK